MMEPKDPRETGKITSAAHQTVVEVKSPRRNQEGVRFL
jgi:hypothetical protein